MPAETQSRPADEAESSPRPTVAACESRPGRTVLIESGNTDGWIASDLVVEPSP